MATEIKGDCIVLHRTVDGDVRIISDHTYENDSYPLVFPSESSARENVEEVAGLKDGDYQVVEVLV